MRISDWSSDVCSSDLIIVHDLAELVVADPEAGAVIRVRGGVADERGDLAEGRARFINQILQIVLRRDIRGDRNRGAVTELRVDFGGGRIARILLAADRKSVV